MSAATDQSYIFGFIRLMASSAPSYSINSLSSDAALLCDVCNVKIGTGGFANHRASCIRRSSSSSESRPARAVPRASSATEADCQGNYQGKLGGRLRGESAAPSDKLQGAARDSDGLQAVAGAFSVVNGGSCVVNKYENMNTRLLDQRRDTELAENIRLELDIARFCLTHSLSLQTGQDMVDMFEYQRPDGAVKLLGYRAILNHLRDDADPHYPDVRMYKFNRELSITVPAGYNGPGASTVVFRCADPMDIIVSILLNNNLHGGKEENIRWGPTHPTTESGERVFDSHLFSGDWAHRTAAKLPKGTDLLAVIVSSDGVILTGSGTQKAHPIMLSIGKLCQEPNLVLDPTEYQCRHDASLPCYLPEYP